MIIPNNTMGSINPDSVSGYISIDGQSVPYNRGHMTWKGRHYLVSDDHGMVVDINRRVIGAVIAGELTPLTRLNAVQLLELSHRYGLAL